MIYLSLSGRSSLLSKAEVEPTLPFFLEKSCTKVWASAIYVLLVIVDQQLWCYLWAHIWQNLKFPFANLNIHSTSLTWMQLQPEYIIGESSLEDNTRTNISTKSWFIRWSWLKFCSWRSTWLRKHLCRIQWRSLLHLIDPILFFLTIRLSYLFLLIVHLIRLLGILQGLSSSIIILIICTEYFIQYVRSWWRKLNVWGGI